MRNRKFIPLYVLVAVLLFTGTALAQIGGIGWYDIATDVRVVGQVLVTENLRVDGNTTFAGDVTISGIVPLPVSGPTTVTNDGSIDCSGGGLVLLTSSGNVGTSTVVTTAVEGVQCILLNEANTTITLTDTGVLLLAGNAAITQHDTVCLVSANNVWYQTCKNAN